MAKKNRLATAKIADGVLTITFTDGTVLRATKNDVHYDIHEQVLLHGVKQKIVDSYAGAESVAQAIANATNVAEALKRGDFSTRVQGGVLAEVLVEITGQTLAAVLAMLESLDDEEYKDLVADETVATAILEKKKARIKKSAKSVDILSFFDKKPKSE